MRLCTTSIVRDGMDYLQRYTEQLFRLQSTLAAYGHELRCVVTEGDSTDDTWPWLQGWAAETNGMMNVTVMKRDHGGEKYGSVNDANRWRNIARTWNAMYKEHIWPADDDAVVYVEADLIWQPADIVRMLAQLGPQTPAIAPMVYNTRPDGTKIFYDIWGYRIEDVKFKNSPPPYHEALINAPPGLIKLSCAASCFVMLGELARVLEFSEEDAMPGASIYANGYSLWLDRRLEVWHP